MKRKGFSAIELVVVLAIISVLIAILAPAIYQTAFAPTVFVEGVVNNKYTIIDPEYGKRGHIEIVMPDGGIETFLTQSHHDEIHPHQTYRLEIRHNRIVGVHRLSNKAEECQK